MDVNKDTDIDIDMDGGVAYREDGVVHTRVLRPLSETLTHLEPYFWPYYS